MWRRKLGIILFCFLIYLTVELIATGCCKSRIVKTDKASESSDWEETAEGKDNGSSQKHILCGEGKLGTVCHYFSIIKLWISLPQVSWRSKYKWVQKEIHKVELHWRTFNIMVQPQPLVRGTKLLFSRNDDFVQVMLPVLFPRNPPCWVAQIMLHLIRGTAWLTPKTLWFFVCGNTYISSDRFSEA